MTLIDFLFDVNAYPARWQCGAWSPTMGWLHIISDAIIFLAYMGIPITLLYFRKRFKDVKVDFAIVLFSAFIFLCGVTHLNDAIVFWYPFYNFAGLIKAMTAVVSLMTLVVIGIKVPKVIKLVNEKTASKIFKEIINCSPQGILVVKGDGNIVFAN